MSLVVTVLKHGHESVTILSLSAVGETAVIQDHILRTDVANQSLVLVSGILISLEKNCYETSVNFQNQLTVLFNFPVDGKYGGWFLKSTCNVTCGEGFKIWTRECNNPKPKHGGRNCSHLGESIKYAGPCKPKAKPCLGKQSLFV